MSIAELVAAKWADILRIVESHGAGNVRVFGSVARGTAGPESDLDLLVDLEPGRTLFDLIAIQQDLEEFLGRRVDVITEAGLSPYLRDAILRDESTLSRDTIRLLRIRDAIARVENYTAIGRELFSADRVCQDAVIWQLEIIGELTNKTLVALRESHPEVPWRHVFRLRDELMQDPFEVSTEMIWDVTQHKLPEFKRGIEAILAEDREN